MYIILTYDVGTKRNPKMLKICRKYLEHVQKSVFEGFISDRQLDRFKSEIEKAIFPEDDQVAIYEFDTLRYTKKILLVII